jgi:hypothetical protein
MAGYSVFKILRRRLLCAVGKHEFVCYEDVPIAGFRCYRCLHCGFLQSTAKFEKRGQTFIKRIIFAIMAVAIFAVLLLLVSQFVGLR